MNANELLDDIWKQRYDANMKYYKPNLIIWMNREDIYTLLRERFDLFQMAEFDEHQIPTKLFGERLIMAPDTKANKPYVEVVT